MEASCYSPPEVEKCAFNELFSLDGPAVDIVGVSDYGTTLAGENGIDHRIHLPFCGPGIQCYSLEAVESKYSALDDSNTDAKQRAPDPLYRLARHREHTQRSTTPIIMVVYGAGRKKLSRLLQRTPQISTEEPDSIIATLNSIYGIIYLPRPRRRRLLHTSLLATGQLMCCAIVRNYEVCHGTPKSWQVPLIPDSQPFLSSLTPLLEHLQNLSTFFFVLLALIYGVLATLQYDTNQIDQLQRRFLFIGIMAGAVIALPSLTKPNEGLALASPLAICTTCALTFSAAVHWFWRTFLTPPKKRLDSTIDRWAREAVEMDTKEHIVKFQEII
ncbi:hypothetical protein K469DRAFT_708808 [Zopfia rhizophila CBS 207.26]|uniref:Uncharacterized protein n=1 Tax=Zopfia rhizophila CBS 207.26 TaxID=1314779 RepID=A0A6A6E048_9PEZI|nr:hypothetical protein K469DRAFT_708808 [Zopfia rhizophila CBS 207.26]